MSRARPCGVKDCIRNAKDGCEGVCFKHYKETHDLPICAVESCNRETNGPDLVHCPPHYQRLRKYGDVQEHIPVKPYKPRGKNTVDVCKIEGCEQPPKTQDLCNGHSQRLRNFGRTFDERPLKQREPLQPKVKEIKFCAVDICNEKARTGGYCQPHYDKYRWYGDPLGKTDRFKNDGPCSIDGCEEQAHTRGWCRLHYGRWKKHGDPLIAPPEPPPTKRSRGGYVRIYAPGHSTANGGNYAPEHRYVMSEALARPLQPQENVHHLNGLRSDNRIENLELWVTCQPSGQRPADLVAHAVEILDRYGDPASYEPDPEKLAAMPKVKVIEYS